MVAKTLLVVAVFAVVNIAAFAEPAPFFLFDDYSYDSSDDSSSEENEKHTKTIYIYLNVTDFHNGQNGQTVPGIPGVAGPDIIPVNIPLNIPGAGAAGQSGISPINIPIKVTFTVGDEKTDDNKE